MRLAFTGFLTNKIVNEEMLKTTRVEYNPKEFKPGLLVRLMLRFIPVVGFKMLNKKLGVKNGAFEKAHDVFSRVDRVDLFPSGSGSRGFILILDKKTALYFYQNSDHFVYDGFELGEYDGGDVTLFDGLK